MLASDAAVSCAAMQAKAMMALIPAPGQVTQHAWLPCDGTDSFLTWPAPTEALNEETPTKVSFSTAHFLWICGLLGLHSCFPEQKFAKHRHTTVCVSSKTAWLMTVPSVQR